MRPMKTTLTNYKILLNWMIKDTNEININEELSKIKDSNSESQLEGLVKIRKLLSISK